MSRLFIKQNITGKQFLVNSFYIISIAVFSVAGLVGYRAGLLRIFLMVIKLVSAAATGYFVSPFVTAVLRENTSLNLASLHFIVFCCITVLCFGILNLLLQRLSKYIIELNKNFLNRITGALAGFALGVTVITGTIVFCGGIEAPSEVNELVQSTGVDKTLNWYAGLANNHFFPAYQNQPVKVMAAEAVDSSHEKGVHLSFTTDVYSIKPEMEAQLLQMINNERNKLGLEPLLPDTLLRTVARLHSADMFSRGYFSHNSPEGNTPFDRLHQSHITYSYAGENLAMASALLKAHEGLMKSPGHRANILNPLYNRAGIGIVDGGRYGLMITEEFRD